MAGLPGGPRGSAHGLPEPQPEPLPLQVLAQVFAHVALRHPPLPALRQVPASQGPRPPLVSAARLPGWRAMVWADTAALSA